MLARHPEITHLAMVHCETTTGMLNPLDEVAALCQRRGIRLIVDAMSSFGGIPIDMGTPGIEFLISSANKCIQGVPGFGFVIARRVALTACAGRARSVSLDLHAQWRTMEQRGASGALPSPTHTVLAFAPGLRAGRRAGSTPAISVTARISAPGGWDGCSRLCAAAARTVAVPIITAFSPAHPDYRRRLLPATQGSGFCHLSGQGLAGRLLRIGNIGDVTPERARDLLAAMASACYWQGDAR